MSCVCGEVYTQMPWNSPMATTTYSAPMTGMSGIPTATVTMVGPDGVGRFVAATGEGPVDAVYKAIDRCVVNSKSRIEWTRISKACP